jgi:protein-S-isoprenylcysteine O-methyltransferase Ste14
MSGTTVVHDLPALTVLAILCAVFVVTVRFTARDAMRRGKSPWLVSALVILFFPVGLLLWFAFRPNPRDSVRSKKFELKNFRAQ